MTHQVALSGAAYQALKKAKDPQESFSQAVLRLVGEHRARARDPWKFVRARRRRAAASARTRLAEVEAWRDSDRVAKRG